MHGPVNGYLSMPCIYLIISRSGGGVEIKALTAFIVERFSCSLAAVWGGGS